MKLILNADDFGITKGVNDGIIEAFEYGIVRSTTMLANSNYFDSSVNLLKKNSGLGVGVHLTLTFGEPLCEDVPSLVSRKGTFFKLAELEASIDKLNLDEVEREFDAQIQRLLAAGIDITHLDTYQHIHRFQNINAIVCALAAKYNVCVRKTSHSSAGVKSTAEFCDKFYNESATALNLKMIVKKYEKLPSLEIVCHPGHSDVELISLSRYNKKREVELAALKNYELLIHFKKTGVEIINFADL